MATPASPESAGAEQPASAAKRLRPLLLVVLPLTAVLALIYLGYQHYQQTRESYLNESYLRALGSVAEQTEGALNGLSTAVDQAVDEWDRQVTLARFETRNRCAAADAADEAIKRILNLSRLQIDDAAASAGASARPAPNPAASELPKIQARVETQRRRESRPSDARRSSAIRSEPVDSAGAQVLFCRAVPKAVQEVARGCPSSATNRTTFCAGKDFGEIVRARLAGNDLEALDVFVIDDRGAVLFERGYTGRRYLAVPSEASAPGASASGALPGPKETGASTIARTITLDGTAYRVFSHPLRLENGGTHAQNWAIVAVVPSDRMESERRVPLIVLAGVPLVLALAVLLLPFLKLATMGRLEALPRSTVFGAGVALMLGASFTTTALLAWLASNQLRTASDAELAHLASIIGRGFGAELDLAYRTLVTYRDRRVGAPKLPPFDEGYVSCENGLDPKKARCRRYGDNRAPGIDEPTIARLASDLNGEPAYPAWRFLVLTNEKGQQCEKWTRQSMNTAKLDMASFSAFSDVKDGHLLALGGDPRRPYALNVMPSPNTGEMLTILSAPIERDGTESLSSLIGAAMMVADLGSVSDPLMPPDTGFAIIARSGQVLYHSNDRLRLYENFFTEVDDGDQLRAAVFASRGGLFDAEYHGQPQRMLLRPLPDSEWSLVVYHDRDGLRMLIVEATLVAALLDVDLLFLYLLWLVGARGLLGPGLRVSLWPDPRAVARYRLLLLPLTGLLVWSVVILWKSDPNGQLLGTVSAALIAVTTTMLVLTLGNARSIRCWLAGVGVLLALIAVAGWVALYTASFLGTVLWIAVAVLSFSAVSGWEPSWIPDGTGNRAATIRQHGFVFVLLLLNLAVMPSLAIVRDTIAAGGVGLMRDRQLQLADSVARRRAANYQTDTVAGGDRVRGFWKQHRKWTEPGLFAFHRAALEVGTPLDGNKAPPEIGGSLMHIASRLELCRDTDVAPLACRFEPNGEVRVDDGGSRRCKLMARHPSAPLLDVFALRIFLRESLERRYTAYGASNCTWGDSDGAGRTQFDLGLNRWKAQHRLRLPDWDIGLRVPRWSALGLLGAIALVLSLGAFTLTHWVVRRIFCVEAWDAPEPGTAIAAGRGRYHLRPSLAERARLSQWAVGGAVIDLSTCDRASDVDAQAATVGAGPVLILHWEHGAADPEWRLATLRMLETLERRGLWIDLASEFDILPYLTSADREVAEDPALLTRWARVLECLDKQRDDLPPAPLPPRTGEAALLYDECRWSARLLGIRAAITADSRWTALTPAALLRHIGDLAEPHYRRIWAELSQEERLTLWHLARDGFVNPHAAAVARDLLRRRLIRRTPALSIVNQSFGQFVLDVEDRATLRAWERAAGASTWSWLRNGVLALVVVGGVLLWVTQPESYTRWVGLLGAVTTIGGGMTQVFGLFQTRRAGS